MTPKAALYPKPTHFLSQTQKIIIAILIIAQLLLISSLRIYFVYHKWGLFKIHWIIPNEAFRVLNFSIDSYFIVNGHVLTSFMLLGGFIFQMMSMLFFRHHHLTMIIHQWIGRLTAFILMPMFCFFSFWISVNLIITPFNRLLFMILPIVIAYAVLKGVYEIIHKRQIQHFDAMYLAFVCLNSAVLFRIFFIIALFLGYPLVSSNYHEPNDFAVILRTISLIIILVISYWSVGRLKENIYPILFLSLGLMIALTCTPWAFLGTTSPH